MEPRTLANVREASLNARRSTSGRAKRPRSAVTSGRKLFVEGNPNSAWSRRYHDLVVGHVADAGGADLLSEAQLSLIRRAAAIECELERLDARLSQSEEVNLDEYGRACSHLRRLFETLGLKRQSRDVTPSPLRDRWALEAEASTDVFGTTAAEMATEPEKLTGEALCGSGEHPEDDAP